VLAYPRKGETLAGFGIGTATARRYVTKTVGLLAARSPSCARPCARPRRGGYGYAVIDGTLIPIDRVAADRPFYCGKHHRHGLEPSGHRHPGRGDRGGAGPLPGAVHDLTAARIWGIVRELAASRLIVLAGKGYHGAGDHIRTPC
jgi:hypothetical protein